MAKLYYKLIKQGKITLDDVPSKWKKAVSDLLDGESDV